MSVAKPDLGFIFWRRTGLSTLKILKNGRLMNVGNECDDVISNIIQIILLVTTNSKSLARKP